MSSTRANTAATPMMTSSGEGGSKEAKVVETVDYRTSAGHGKQERKPVAVVHEYPTGEKKDKSSDSPKQD